MSLEAQKKTISTSVGFADWFLGLACLQPPVPSIVPLRDFAQGGCGFTQAISELRSFCAVPQIERSGWDRDNWQA